MSKLITLLFLAFTLVSTSCDVSAGERKQRTPNEVISLVHKASAYLKNHGREQALAEMNNPKGSLIDGELYLFVFNLNGDGINLVNTAFPTLVGKNLKNMRDPDGVHLIKEFLKVANSKEGKGWVDYKWPNRMNGNFVELKSSYIERSGDLLIGCGIPKIWTNK